MATILDHGLAQLPRTSETERLFFRILYGTLVVLALSLFGIDYADPNDFKWVMILPLAAISLIWMAAHAFMRETLALDALDLSVMGFLAFALLSLVWSIDPLSGWAIVAKMVILVAIFLGIKNCADEALLRSICWAVASAIAIVLAFVYLKIGELGGFGNTNFITEFLLAALPFAAALGFFYRSWAMRAAVGILISTVLVYLFAFNISNIEFLVLPGVTLLSVGAYFWRRSKKVVMIAVVTIIVAVGAFVLYKWDASHGFRESIYSRVGLNINTAMMWLDAPVLGHGGGSFNALYPYYQSRHLAIVPDPRMDLVAAQEEVVGAAHNEYLQLLATFGLAGLGFVALCGFFLLRGVARNGATVAVGAGLAVTGVWTLNALVEFPWQNPATALLATLGLGFAARAARNDPPLLALPVSRLPGLVILGGAMIASGVAAWGGWRFHAANHQYRETIRMLYAREPARAFAYNREAVRLYPLETNFRTHSYVVTSHWMEMNEGRPPLSADETDRLFDFAVKAGPTTQLVIARVQYLIKSGRMKENGGEIDKWLDFLRTNVSRSPDVWLLIAYHDILNGKWDDAATDVVRAEKLGMDLRQKGLAGNLRGVLVSLRKQGAGS